ncbi:MAG: hypothetical protein HZA14_07430 [Nitrospirae bacterium]|nr:hypothetical protein [Nitrospirota bacterium]
MPKYYLRIEAVNLSNFVYDTVKIQPMRGGSYLLLECAGELGGKDFGGIKLVKIMAGASIGLFWFEVPDNNGEISKKAEGVTAEVSKFLNEKTDGHATFVVDIILYTDENNFLNDTETLTAMNRWRQFQQPTLILPEVFANSSNEPCAYDGVRPGVVTNQTSDGCISDSVNFRKTKGCDLRSSIYKRIIGGTEPNARPCLLGGLSSIYKRIIGGTELRDDFTDDLESLSLMPSMGNLNGKMAVFYVDGNKFTKIRGKTCTADKELTAFDDKLQSLNKSFLKSLLKDAKSDPCFKTKDGKIRLEILLWGGDEIELIVPAWKGLEVMSLYYETMKDANFSECSITYGGGVVFCNHKTPIREVRKTVRALADMAKKGVPDDVDKIKGDVHNVCHYLVLESFEVVGKDVNGFVKQYYRSRYDDLVITPATMDNVMKTIKLMKQKKFPRNKIFDIIHALRSGSGATAIKDILERALSGIDAADRTTLKEKIDAVIVDKINRWFWFADLWDYAGNSEVQI